MVKMTTVTEMPDDVPAVQSYSRPRKALAEMNKTQRMLSGVRTNQRSPTDGNLMIPASEASRPLADTTTTGGATGPQNRLLAGEALDNQGNSLGAQVNREDGKLNPDAHDFHDPSRPRTGLSPEQEQIAQANRLAQVARQRAVERQLHEKKAQDAIDEGADQVTHSAPTSPGTGMSPDLQAGLTKSEQVKHGSQQPQHPNKEARAVYREAPEPELNGEGTPKPAPLDADPSDDAMLGKGE